ncbi:MAG: hypothetical protein DMH00_02465 [Acidobacteria bacterium]|nr:MAG: hypothetical protein DMH00_02465 [Acidobacteriota bacterium]
MWRFSRVFHLGHLPGLLLILGAALPGPLVASSESGPRAGPGLVRELQRQGEVQAVVMLHREQGSGAPTPQALVEDVLRRVPSAEVVVQHRLETVPVFIARITDRGLSRLMADPRVSKVDLDGVVMGADLESAAQIGADRVQALEIRGQGITVAVIDSGTDILENPDLDPSLVGEECFCSYGGGCCPDGSSRQSGPGSARSLSSHGPGVIGVIASRGSIAPAGIAPGASILAVRVLSDSLISTFSDVLVALDWVVSQAPGVRVVNLSLAAGPYVPPCDQADLFNEALAQLAEVFRGRGGLLVAAAGNNARSDMLGSPACVSGVLSVGAVDREDQIPFFSNGGPTLDLLAPGVGIVTDGSFGRLESQSGTSFAAPHVSGAAALLLSANPGLSPADVEERLKSRGVPVTDPRTSRITPRVDVFHALLLPMDLGLSPGVISPRSRGHGFKIWLEPQSPFAAADLDPDTVTLSVAGGAAVLANAFSATLGDENQDGIPDLSLHFDRRRLLSGISESGALGVEARGTFISGIQARGTGTLKILPPRGLGSAQEPSP